MIYYIVPELIGEKLDEQPLAGMARRAISLASVLEKYEKVTILGMGKERNEMRHGKVVISLFPGNIRDFYREVAYVLDKQIRREDIVHIFYSKSKKAGYLFGTYRVNPTKNISYDRVVVELCSTDTDRVQFEDDLIMCLKGGGVFSVMNKAELGFVETVREKFPISVINVPNAVDSNIYTPGYTRKRERMRSLFGISLDSIAIVTTGRLAESKKLDCLVKSFPSVLEKFPSSELIICGSILDIPKKRREYIKTGHRLKSIARSCGVSNSLRILPNVAAKDIAGILQCCDIFVMPSSREGMPTSLLEAMSTGLVCVVSDIPGNWDLIRSDSLRFELGDDARLAEILKMLISDSRKRNVVGNKNRELILSQYESSNVAERFLGIYKTLV